MARVLSLVGGCAGATAVGWAAAAQEPAPPESGAAKVDIELVLAVDASRSMDLEEQEIQRQGYAEAFRDPGVVSAMIGGYYGRIAVTYFEWANEYAQRQTVPWTLIDSPEAAAQFAQAIDDAPLGTELGTSISGALDTSEQLLRTNAYEGMKRVVDVSGDGQNISGPYLAPIRDRLVRNGIVINGLPLMLRPFEAGDLSVYYEQEVIGGQGAFVIPVYDTQTLASSIRSKLILEIAGALPHEQRAELEIRGGAE